MTIRSIAHARRSILAFALSLAAIGFFAPPSPNQPAVRAADPKITESFAGKVVSIADGDTITVLAPDKKRVIVRLEGIDAPERGQEHGTKAKDALADMVLNKTVTIRKTGTDRYDRTLGFVEVDGKDVNLKLVEAGWAWHFTKYNDQEKFAKAEVSARKAKRGLWSHDRPMAPWDFRALKKPKTEDATATPPPVPKATTPEPAPKAEPATPAAAKERFWLNTKSGVRHNSGCKHFNNTKAGRFCGPNEGKACGICDG